MSNLRLFPFPWGPIFPAPIRHWGFSPTRVIVATVISLFVLTSPVLAHHPLGGAIPSTWFEGFMSGLAHPILGPDHFVFVAAAGLLASIKRQGVFIPIAFVLTGLVGAGIHLMSLNLPNPEVFISASVLLFGLMLAMKHSPNAMAIAGLAAISGLFHGYAYGEAIIGAEMTPLVAYLAGFTVIQLGIALLAFQIDQLLIQRRTEQPLLTLRFVGFAIGGAGAAFLSSAMLG